MSRFASQSPRGQLVQELERLVRADVFKPGEQCRGRHCLQVQGLFGSFELWRDYYYHPGKGAGPLSSRQRLGSGGRLHARFGPADVLGGGR